MTKLIVEMEMPKCCPCELATEIEGSFYTCFAYYGVVERAVEFDKCMRDGTRPAWCPIKGVLPDEHGRLIDADDVNNHIIGYVDLRGCPTIVEAAERKDDENI